PPFTCDTLQSINSPTIYNNSSANTSPHNNTKHHFSFRELFFYNAIARFSKSKTTGIIGNSDRESKKLFKIVFHALAIHCSSVAILHGTQLRVEYTRRTEANAIGLAT